jgi:hypothetical protein
MLIVVIVWAVWLNKRQPEVNTAVKSLVAIGFLGIALLIGLIVI